VSNGVSVCNDEIVIAIFSSYFLHVMRCSLHHCHRLIVIKTAVELATKVNANVDESGDRATRQGSPVQRASYELCVLVLSGYVPLA